MAKGPFCVGGASDTAITFATDTTLIKSCVAADAKVTGDKLNQANQRLDKTIVGITNFPIKKGELMLTMGDGSVKYFTPTLPSDVIQYKNSGSVLMPADQGVNPARAEFRLYSDGSMLVYGDFGTVGTGISSNLSGSKGTITLPHPFAFDSYGIALAPMGPFDIVSGGSTRSTPLIETKTTTTIAINVEQETYEHVYFVAFGQAD